MSLKTIFDPTLELPKIKVPIYSVSEKTDPDVTGKFQNNDQTKRDGILTPLFRFCDITILSPQVEYMRLSCSGRTPELNVRIRDAMSLIQIFSRPSRDNSFQMQMMAPFDGAYKKINLLFYMTDVSISGAVVTITARLNVPGLYDSYLYSFGLLPSFDLFAQVAQHLKLGLCSNVDSTDDDRYMYCHNTKLLQLLDQEVKMAGSKENPGSQVFDYWVDYWNYVNFVDIRKQYESKESADKVTMWVVPNKYTNTESDVPDQKPVNMEGFVTNNPYMTMWPTYVGEYVPVTTSGAQTDLVFDRFMMADLEAGCVAIKDDDVKNDVFSKYQYGGEVFGDYDYLTQRAVADMYRYKMKTQQIQVTLSQPQLSFMRGHKINFYWYNMNEPTKRIQADQGGKVNSDTLDLSDDMDTTNINGDSNYVLDRSVSGQYYIDCSDYIYEEGRWSHVLTLSRPASQNHSYELSPGGETGQKQ